MFSLNNEMNELRERWMSVFFKIDNKNDYKRKSCPLPRSKKQMTVVLGRGTKNKQNKSNNDINKCFKKLLRQRVHIFFSHTVIYIQLLKIFKMLVSALNVI